MINRYSRKHIKDIWSEENKYKIWLDIEIAAAEAMEKIKVIPKGIAKKIKKKAKINVGRIHKIENKVHHDVIAFLTSITEKVGPDGKFLHKGMTSSDVLDTCFNLQLKQSGELLLNDVKYAGKVLHNNKDKIRVDYQLKDGSALKFLLWQEKEMRWVAVEAVGGENALKVNARTKGWAYNIPDYYYELLSKKKQQLVKKIEQKP